MVLYKIVNERGFESFQLLFNDEIVYVNGDINGYQVSQEFARGFVAGINHKAT